MMDFLLAYLVSLGIEAPLLYLVLRRRFDWSAIALNAVIATSMTIPFVWFLFPLLSLPWAAQTALAELFAFIAEACVFRMLFQKLAWKDALAASALCNAASFLAGLPF